MHLTDSLCCLIDIAYIHFNVDALLVYNHFMLYTVAVVAAFFICWAPFHAQRLMTIYIKSDNWTPKLIEVQNIIFHISGK